MTWNATSQTTLFATTTPTRPNVTVHYPNGATATPTDLGTVIATAARLLTTTGKAHLSDTTGWAVTITTTGEQIHQPHHGHEQPSWVTVAINRLRENQ